MSFELVRTILWPKSIAVVGASGDASKISGRLFRYIVRNGYAGEIFPINPSYAELEGRRCFPSVQAIGKPIDLALIAIPARAVVGELERCASAGVRNAVIVSAGFAEEGGDAAQLQTTIANLAKKTGMHIVGPNAEGFYNADAKLAATFSPTLAEPWSGQLISGARRLGVIAQSGGVGFAIYDLARRNGLAVAYVVTTGNEVDLTLADFLEFMVEDESTDIVMLFCEAIRDAGRFERAASRAIALGKRIVAIKVGQSESGRRATISHTATIAGWNAAYNAVFEKYGVLMAHDVEEALAIAGLLATGLPPRGPNIAVVTTSGGAGALVADSLERNGAVLPQLDPQIREKIRACIPSYGSPNNPADVTAQGSSNAVLSTTVEALCEQPNIDAIFFIASAAQKKLSFEPGNLKRLGEKKPLIVYSYTYPSPEARVALADGGIFLHTDISAACAAVGKLAKATSQLTAQGGESASAQFARPKILDEAPLCEYQVKAMLRELGVPVPKERLARDESSALAAVEEFGYPVALKIQSPLIPHKTDVGGVWLNVDSNARLSQGFRALTDVALSHVPRAAFHGVLVQKMAPKGPEFIIGVIKDPVFGPIISLGFGGVAVELFRDIAYRVAPVSEKEARTMLNELRSSVMLNGFRGGPTIDPSPILELVVQLSHIAIGLADDIDELELNPVILHADGTGLTIADALVSGRPMPAV